MIPSDRVDPPVSQFVEYAVFPALKGGLPQEPAAPDLVTVPNPESLEGSVRNFRQIDIRDHQGADFPPITDWSDIEIRSKRNITSVNMPPVSNRAGD